MATTDAGDIAETEAEMNLRVGVALFVACLARWPVSICYAQADELGVRATVAEFYAAYGKKDLEAITSLWSAGAATLVASRESFRREFAVNRIGVRAVESLQPLITGGRATIRVAVEIDAVDMQSGQAAEGFGKRNRLFELNLEAGRWKILRYVPVEQGLADRLSGLTDVVEATRLLAVNPEMVTAELVSILNAEATLRSRQGSFEAALRQNDFATAAAARLGDRVAVGWTLVTRASIFLDQTDTGRTLESARQALGMFRDAGYRRGEAAAQNRIGKALLLTGQMTEARQAFEGALTGAREAHDAEIEVRALNNLGEVDRQQTSLDSARQRFEEALRLAKATGSRTGESDALTNLANLWLMQGNGNQALPLLRAGLDIDVSLEDERGQAIDLGAVGLAYELTNQFPEALAMYEKSLELKRKLGDREGEALTLINVRVLKQRLGQYSEAVAAYEESRKVANLIPSPSIEANALNNLGTVYIETHQLAKAWTSLKAAAELEKQTGDEAAEAQTLGNLGLVDWSTNRLDEALEVFTKILKYFQRNNLKTEEASTRHNIAAIHQRQGRNDLAEADFRIALEIQRVPGDTTGHISTLTDLAAVMNAAGRTVEATENAKQAISLSHEMKSPVQEATAKVILGTILASTDARAARTEYTEALDLAGGLGWDQVEITAQTLLGTLDQSEQRWVDSVTRCEKAVEAVERYRAATAEPLLQMDLFAGNLAPYHCLVKGLVELRRSDEALQAADRAKAKSLVDLLERGGLHLSDKDLSAGERDHLAVLEARVDVLLRDVRVSPLAANVGPQLQLARREVDEYRRTLFLNYQGLADKQSRSAPITNAELAKMLPDEKTALVEFLVGDTQSFAFVIRKKRGAPDQADIRPRAIKTGRSDLARLVAAFAAERSKLTLRRVPSGRMLYDLLLGDLRQDLEGISTLGIIPDMELSGLSFAALQDATGRYVVESYATFYAPSLAALRAMRQTGILRRGLAVEPGPEMLVVANPELGPTHRMTLLTGQSIGELPGAEAESALIKRLAGARARVISGREARKALVKEEMANFRQVYFATHHIPDDAAPLYSSLILAQVDMPGDNGILTAYEVKDLNLKADFVVLSACSSGGKAYGGEGLLGFSWALFAAGVPSSIVASWPISDDKSGGLMPTFYRLWWDARRADGTRLSKAEALQKAQVGFLRSRQGVSNPYFWAPFMLTGDWE